MTYCKCCQLEDAIFGPQRSFNDLPMALIVCNLCSRHQRSLPADLIKRDREHCEMWAESKRYALEDLTERHEKEIARLEAHVETLQEELDNRPVQVVTENLDIEEVQQAHEDAETAYHKREHAFLQLTRIHMLHYEAQVGKCRCGIPTEECDVAWIVDNFRALKNWEHNQTARRRQGRDHMLPANHPGIIDARWDPDDDEVAEFAPYRNWDATG